MKRTHEEVKSIPCQGAFGKENDSSSCSLCMKEFSWAASDR